MPEIGHKAVKTDIDLVDETFDVSQSGSCYLSIQIEQDGLSFCVFNTVINKYIVLRNYPFLHTAPHEMIDECSSIFANDDLLRLKYKSSGLLWISPRSTLVPDDLFDPGKADTYLSFNHGELASEQTQHNFIRSAGLYHVFSCPESLVNLLSIYQPKIHLFHQTAPLIESMITKIDSQDKLMAIYYYSHNMDIMVVENKKLLFCNSFQINAPEDSVYYLAGVSNILNVEPLSTNLLYAGDIKRLPPEVAILKDYVERLVEFEPPNTVTYSYLITEPLRKNFINLFNLSGCES
jgi:hypothetical protein